MPSIESVKKNEEENEKGPVQPLHGHWITEISKHGKKSWFGSSNRWSNKASSHKTHIFTVNLLANKEEIVQKAVAKRASFDQTFNETLKYALLFLHFREVSHVPGTNDKFTFTSKQSLRNLSN